MLDPGTSRLGSCIVCYAPSLYDAKTSPTSFPNSLSSVYTGGAEAFCTENVRPFPSRSTVSLGEYSSRSSSSAQPLSRPLVDDKIEVMSPRKKSSDPSNNARKPARKRLWNIISRRVKSALNDKKTEKEDRREKEDSARPPTRRRTTKPRSRKTGKPRYGRREASPTRRKRTTERRPRRNDRPRHRRKEAS